MLCTAKIDRQENGFALCLPLEGKVSAEPTDEVLYIRCKTKNKLPYHCGSLLVLSVYQSVT